MDDKEEQQTTHIYLDGRELSKGEWKIASIEPNPVVPTIINNLTDAELNWLADEISKRLATRMRSGLGVRA